VMPRPEHGALHGTPVGAGALNLGVHLFI
jgi:hypothetical protein